MAKRKPKPDANQPTLMDPATSTALAEVREAVIERLDAVIETLDETIEATTEAIAAITPTDGAAPAETQPSLDPTRLSEPGIYDNVPEAAYHADPCPTPSLSRSVLLRLIENSPRHAFLLHPRLNPPLDEDTGSDDEIQDYGTAAHASFLQGRSIIDRLDFPDWRTNKAKEARAASYAEGRIPLLTKSYNRAMNLIDVLEGFRSRTGAFTKGRPEQTVIWQEGPIWCRCRVDWLPDEPEASPWDLKTTSGFATLAAWSRIAWSKGAHLQDSFYARGLECTRGEPPGPMKFCVVEQKAPYGIGVFEMTPVTRDLADQDVSLGLRTWADCLASGEWATYTEETQYVDPPGWMLRERESRAMLTPRNLDLLRGRDHPNTAGYLESGNFGG